MFTWVRCCPQAVYIQPLCRDFVGMDRKLLTCTGSRGRHLRHSLNLKPTKVQASQEI